ncbi:MAG: DUF5131 family protein [Actinomycetota bacterium]
MTSIEWTDATWNPVTGCRKVSAGCKHCYAERVFPRACSGRTVPCERCDGEGGWLLDEGADEDRPAPWKDCPDCGGSGARLRRFTDVLTHPERLDRPLRWRRPRRVFVNSMSDLFHEDVPADFIAEVWGVMACAPQHTFQVLTKRPTRARALLTDTNGWVVTAHDAAVQWVRELGLPDGGPPENYLCTPAQREALPALPNVYLGVSVEDQATADERIPLLLDTPAALRFISYEPALGPVDFSDYLTCGSCGAGKRLPDHAACDWGAAHAALDWIIVGGESGPQARPFDLAWARQTIAQCRAAGIPCFVKQLGARPTIHHDPHNPAIGSGYNGGLVHRAGRDPEEWPEDLRVREWPA